MTLRDQFVERRRIEEETISFFAGGVRHFTGEGYEMLRDVTDQTISESKRRIKMYDELIAKIDANN